MGLFKSRSRYDDACDLEENQEIFQTLARKLVRKLQDASSVITEEEVNAFRNAYDNIEQFCEKYKYNSDASSLRENANGVFQVLYPKACARSSKSV